MEATTIFFMASAIFGDIAGPIGLGSTLNQLHKIGVPPSSMPPPKRNTIVRVGIGLDNTVIPDHPLIDSQGPSPMVVAFDEDKEWVGMSNWVGGGNINNGGYYDIEVFHLQDREYTQATHLQIVARDGPICVAYILETWSDDTHRGWVGNQGPACGYEWGFSNIILGQNEPDFKPCELTLETHRLPILLQARNVDKVFQSAPGLTEATPTGSIRRHSKSTWYSLPPSFYPPFSQKYLSLTT